VDVFQALSVPTIFFNSCSNCYTFSKLLAALASSIAVRDLIDSY
jgi:hypothetical protein